MTSLLWAHCMRVVKGTHRVSRRRRYCGPVTRPWCLNASRVHCKVACSSCVSWLLV